MCILTFNASSREQIDIVFEQGKNQSAAYINGEQIGECEISVSENIRTITHTGVRPEYGGRGIAKKLVMSVIEAARENNAELVSLCSYADKLTPGKEEFKETSGNSLPHISTKSSQHNIDKTP